MGVVTVKEGNAAFVSKNIAIHLVKKPSKHCGCWSVTFVT
jgi:hypothetical protein